MIVFKLNLIFQKQILMFDIELTKLIKSIKIIFNYYLILAQNREVLK